MNALPIEADPLAPLYASMQRALNKKLCCGPKFGVFVDGKRATCGAPSTDEDEAQQPYKHVEPPIAKQEETQKRLRELLFLRTLYRQKIEIIDMQILIEEQKLIPF